jgi:acetyl-CoA C-acetyltransferase
VTEDIVIVAAARTAIGKLGGALASVSAADLGAGVIAACLERVNLPADHVSDVIMGQVLQGGCGQNPARQAAIKAGLPNTVPAMTINQVCGAGQRSIHLAAQAIRCGDADIVVAGGQDSMTLAPHVLRGLRNGVRMGDASFVDTMIIDGLQDAFHGIHMGITAEEIARRHQVTRGEQDEFAATSQRKAGAALEAHRFAEEIVPLEVAGRWGSVVVDTDEYPRPGTTVEQLASLKPIFSSDGTVTAGNASGVNDGAAAVMVMSARRAAELGLEPLARIAACAAAGVDPMIMGMGPVPASCAALAKAGWKAADLDLMEVNEAFAAQAIAVNREMGWDPNRANVNGGAIALGHPLAGSGCRIVVTLLYEMMRRDAHKGLATMCIGGGQGVAICLER